MFPGVRGGVEDIVVAFRGGGFGWSEGECRYHRGGAGGGEGDALVVIGELVKEKKEGLEKAMSKKLIDATNLHPNTMRY